MKKLAKAKSFVSMFMLALVLTFMGAGVAASVPAIAEDTAPVVAYAAEDFLDGIKVDSNGHLTTPTQDSEGTFEKLLSWAKANVGRFRAICFIALIGGIAVVALYQGLSLGNERRKEKANKAAVGIVIGLAMLGGVGLIASLSFGLGSEAV